MVLRRSLATAGAGLGVGLVLALALGRLLSSLLVGISASDPVILATVSVLVLGVVLGASYLPARRASRVDPLVVLRQD